MASPVSDKDLETIAAFIFGILALVLVSVLSLFAIGYMVRLGWNWSMPILFGLPEASYRNACGIALLAWAAKLSFGGLQGVKECRNSRSIL